MPAEVLTRGAARPPEARLAGLRRPRAGGADVPAAPASAASGCGSPMSLVCHTTVIRLRPTGNSPRHRPAPSPGAANHRDGRTRPRPRAQGMAPALTAPAQACPAPWASGLRPIRARTRHPRACSRWSNAYTATDSGAVSAGSNPAGGTGQRHNSNTMLILTRIAQGCDLRKRRHVLTLRPQIVAPQPARHPTPDAEGHPRRIWNVGSHTPEIPHRCSR